MCQGWTVRFLWTAPLFSDKIRAIIAKVSVTWYKMTLFGLRPALSCFVCNFIFCYVIIITPDLFWILHIIKTSETQIIQSNTVTLTSPWNTTLYACCISAGRSTKGGEVEGKGEDAGLRLPMSSVTHQTNLSQPASNGRSGSVYLCHLLGHSEGLSWKSSADCSQGYPATILRRHPSKVTSFKP